MGVVLCAFQEKEGQSPCFAIAGLGPHGLSRALEQSLLTSAAT